MVRQLLSPKPVATLAARFSRPNQLGLGLGAQGADRGVQMHQVGAELRETGVKCKVLASQLGALADQGGGGDVHAAMVESRRWCSYLAEGELTPQSPRKSAERGGRRPLRAMGPVPAAFPDREGGT